MEPTSHDILVELLTFGTRTQKRILRDHIRTRDVTLADFVSGFYAPMDEGEIAALLQQVLHQP